MNLYHLTRRDRRTDGYVAAVVCAKDEEAASNFHPSGVVFDVNGWEHQANSRKRDWVSCREEVKVKLIGEAFSGRAEVIVANFQHEEE